MAIGFFELVIVLLVVGFFVAVFSGKGRGLALGLLGAFGFALVLVITIPFLAYRASESGAIVAQEQQPPPWVTQGMGVRAQGSGVGGGSDTPAEPKTETAPVLMPETPNAEEAPKSEPPKEAESPKPEEAPKAEPPKAEEPKAEEAPKPAEAPKAEEAPKPDAPKTEPSKAEEPPKPAEPPKAEEGPKPAEAPKAEEAPKSEPPKEAEAPKPSEAPKTEPPKAEEPPKPAEAPKPDESPKAEPPKAEEPPKPADEKKSESSAPAAAPSAGPSKPEPPKPEPPKPEPPKPEPPKPEPPKPESPKAEADPGTVQGFVESVNKQGNQPTAPAGSPDYQGTIQPSDPTQPWMRVQVKPPNSSGGSASRSYRAQTGAPMPWAAAHTASFAVGGLMVIGVLVFVPILVLLANRKSRPYALGVLGFLVLLAGPIMLFGLFWMRGSVRYDVAREQQQRAIAQLDMERLDHGGRVTQPAVAPPPSVALSAEAEPGKTPPAAKRPAWVDEPARRVNGVYRTKITIGPYATRAEIDQLLPRELQRATAAYLDRLEPGTGQRTNVRLSYIDQRIVQEEWEETTQASFGPMLQLHVLLQFDDSVRNDLQQMYRNQVVEQRVLYTTGLAGLVVILLGTVFCFLKLDTATKGYYTGRLLLAAAAMILGVVIAGAFACMA